MFGRRLKGVPPKHPKNSSEHRLARTDVYYSRKTEGGRIELIPYDAEQTIQTFAAAARDEVDLNKISDHLTILVEETMQPKTVSLWLRAWEKPEL